MQNAVAKVSVDISVMIGQAVMPIKQLLKMGRGAVIDLDAKHDDPVSVFANNQLIAKGEIVIVGERLGVNITEVIAYQRS